MSPSFSTSLKTVVPAAFPHIWTSCLLSSHSPEALGNLPSPSSPPLFLPGFVCLSWFLQCCSNYSGIFCVWKPDHLKTCFIFLPSCPRPFAKPLKLSQCLPFPKTGDHSPVLSLFINQHFHGSGFSGETMTLGQVLPWPLAPHENGCHSTGGVVPPKKYEDRSFYLWSFHGVLPWLWFIRTFECRDSIWLSMYFLYL